MTDYSSSVKSVNDGIEINGFEFDEAQVRLEYKRVTRLS